MVLIDKWLGGVVVRAIKKNVTSLCTVAGTRVGIPIVQ